MDLDGMSEEEYKRATATYTALIALRDKVCELIDVVDDVMRQQPMHSRASFLMSEARYAGLNREEYQQVKWLERLYGQINKEAVKQDKEQDDEKASEWGLSSESDEELIARFNREVGCGGWVSAGAAMRASSGVCKEVRLLCYRRCVCPLACSQD